MPSRRVLVLALAAAVGLVACSAMAPWRPEDKRPQDARTSFKPASPGDSTFAALAPAAGDTVDVATTSRWAGVLGGAAYRVEVPADWNGKLVMYAHGYAGEGNALVVQNPGIRRYLVQHGYAWAASSYSKNFYDVRAGVEDTNALALEFNRIAAAAGRSLPVPSKVYITGVSMGAHITAAAIEDEAYATEKHKIRYNGAVPMCGVVGDTALFDYFAGAQLAAQAIAGVPHYPFGDWADISTQVTNALFITMKPTITLTPAGVQFASVLENLTGGQRPMFDIGLAVGGSFPIVWGIFGGDGTVNGIVNKNIADTNRFSYAIEGDPAASAALNAKVLKLSKVPEANRLRSDGLRWIPKVNGEIHVPVVSLHTLGDLYVPFGMEQVYRQRVAAKGNDRWLVQRAIRGATHCDFTVAEEATAFEDMVRWERDGVVPRGDDVLTPATVAAAGYGCGHTQDTIGPDDRPEVARLRAYIAQHGPACPR